MPWERIADLKAVLAESERQAGADHPTTLEARVRLALAYRERDRDEEAVAALRQVVAARDGTLGAGHPDTLAAKHELALCYFHVSIGNDNPARLSDAVATMELAADGRLSALGPAHSDTLASWVSLAFFCSRAGHQDDRGRILRSAQITSGASPPPPVEDLAAHIARRERGDAEARWNELIPAYQDLAANIG